MGEKETADEAFYERNMLALLYADAWYWHEGWKVLVINHRVIGQLTYHVPPDFDVCELSEIKPCWNRETTTEKHEKIRFYRQWIPCPGPLREDK
jgi:hypothetical protein